MRAQHFFIFSLSLILLCCSCRPQPKVSISSDPVGATLWEEDELVGQTPLVLPLPARESRKLIVRHPGCLDTQLTLEPGKGSRTTKLHFKMEEPPERYFTLRCTSTPSGAEIFLDGEFKGKTPFEFSALPLGQSELLFRLKDRQEVREMLFFTAQSPESSELHLALPSLLLPYYRQLIESEPAVVHHYADLGHFLMLEGEIAEAVKVFHTGLRISLAGKSAGDDGRLWSEIDRVIVKQYDYGDAETVQLANHAILKLLRELKQEFPSPGSLSFYTCYAVCADKLNHRQEAQNIFDEAWAKWSDNRQLQALKKNRAF